MTLGPICPDSGAVITQVFDAGIELRCAPLAHNQEPTGLNSRPRYQDREASRLTPPSEAGAAKTLAKISPDQTTMPRAASRSQTQNSFEIPQREGGNSDGVHVTQAVAGESDRHSASAELERNAEAKRMRTANGHALTASTTRRGLQPSGGHFAGIVTLVAVVILVAVAWMYSH